MTAPVISCLQLSYDAAVRVAAWVRVLEGRLSETLDNTVTHVILTDYNATPAEFKAWVAERLQNSSLTLVNPEWINECARGSATKLGWIDAAAFRIDVPTVAPATPASPEAASAHVVAPPVKAMQQHAVVTPSVATEEEVSRVIDDLVMTVGPANLSNKIVREILEKKSILRDKQSVKRMVDEALVRYAQASSPSLTPAPSASKMQPSPVKPPDLTVKSPPLHQDVSAGKPDVAHIFESIGGIFLEPTHFNQTVILEMQQLIRSLGGQQCTELEECTYVVVLFKNGEYYQQAVTQGKFVVTYFWLHECQRTGRVVSSVDNPLCKPGLDGGIPELAEAVICSTGFTDDTAICHTDVEDLVQVVGAKFSGDLKRSTTTHLVVHRAGTAKHKEAMLWQQKSLHIVTYHWLKDSHLQCKRLPESEYPVNNMSCTLPDAFMSQQSQDAIDKETIEGLEPVAKKAKHTRPRFLLTGISKKERKTLVKLIARLGGDLCNDDEHFEESCTHIVVHELKRTEKVLFACIAGAWFITPEYITMSAEAGKLIDPTPYEIYGLGFEMKGSSKQLKLDRFRFWRQKRENSESPFQGWVVATLGNHKTLPCETLRRLIQGGGGRLVELSPELTLEGLKLVVLGDTENEKDSALFERLTASRIPCVRDTFICDFILLDQDLEAAASSSHCLLPWPVA